jgi:hypothetical protein
MEPTIEAHFSRIKERLTRGREILAAMNESDMKPYEVPDVTVDRGILHLSPPLPQDKCVYFCLS